MRLRDQINDRIEAMQQLLAKDCSPTTRELLEMQLRGSQIGVEMLLVIEHLNVSQKEISDSVGILVKAAKDLERERSELEGMQKVLKFVRPAVQACLLVLAGFGWSEYQNYQMWRQTVEMWKRNHCIHHIYEERSTGGKIAIECTEFADREPNK